MAKKAEKTQNINVEAGGKPLKTPAGNAFEVPTQALADAISEEWQGKKSFNAANMPLTALAYTAIDRIGSQHENIVEVMLAYVDTDTLCYRSENSKKLQDYQHRDWDPILAWAGHQFSALWQTTSGVMPIEQSPALHEAIRDYCSKMDAMRLGAAALLASLYSSIVLAVAVVEKRLSATEAFTLSRLEENAQAEEWGEDEAATLRQENILREIKDIARFLDLLGQP